MIFSNFRQQQGKKTLLGPPSVISLAVKKILDRFEIFFFFIEMELQKIVSEWRLNAIFYWPILNCIFKPKSQKNCCLLLPPEMLWGAERQHRRARASTAVVVPLKSSKSAYFTQSYSENQSDGSSPLLLKALHTKR